MKYDSTHAGFKTKEYKKYKLENVHWSSVPVQIGDPIMAPPGEYVLKKNVSIQVSPLLIPWQRKTFGRG